MNKNQLHEIGFDAFVTTKHFFLNTALFSTRNSTEFLFEITSLESSVSLGCPKKSEQRRFSGLYGVQYGLNAA